jgi:serine/threonine-protein kinase SRPK3
MSGKYLNNQSEVYLDRYHILQKLGWGHFSTVWLAKDVKFNTYVAIKVQKSAQNYLEAAYDEVEILQELEKHNYEKEWKDSVNEYWRENPEKLKHGIDRDHSQVVQLLNSFIHHGPNGRHFCMVFEIMGVTLLEIMKRYNYKGVTIIYNI